MKFFRQLPVILCCFAWLLAGCQGSARAVQSETAATYQPDASCADRVAQMRANPKSGQPLPERYRGLTVIDAHNHDAARNLSTLLRRWDQFNIQRVVLFGDISEPSAQRTDELAFQFYRDHPDRVYPFFAGVPIYDDEALEGIRANLERGYFGIGEIVGASTYSPVTSRLAWKAEHPNDGNLPEIYRLAAEYHVPVLLHIDPPEGFPIQQLEAALEANPDTIIIFGHANAYNSLANLEPLLGRHPNLYIDFFAGFTAYNPDSAETLADYAPLIEGYPDRFVVSTDSGYDLGYDKAATALYELIDLLQPATACKIAYQNVERLMEEQPPTAAQLARIRELSAQTGGRDEQALNKRQAHEIIFELEKNGP